MGVVRLHTRRDSRSTLVSGHRCTNARLVFLFFFGGGGVGRSFARAFCRARVLHVCGFCEAGTRVRVSLFDLRAFFFIYLADPSSLPGIRSSSASHFSGPQSHQFHCPFDCVFELQFRRRPFLDSTCQKLYERSACWLGVDDVSRSPLVSRSQVSS